MLKLGRDLGISEKLEVVSKRDSFLLLRDFEESLYRKKQPRLINPMINQCGVINKTTLDCLNSEFRSHERVNQA